MTRPLDATIELVYVPDAARLPVDMAVAADCDAPVFQLPEARTMPRQCVELVYQAAGRKPRVFGVPPWRQDATARPAEFRVMIVPNFKAQRRTVS